jgi:hypothetical protein
MKTLLADVIGVSRSDRPRSASRWATLFRCKCANARTILGQAAIIVRITVNYEEFPARFREAGSFIAGFLIGVSIVVLVFASIGANMSDWQTLLVFGSPIILILGVTLQVVTTAKPRHERMIITDRRPSSGFEDVIPRNRAFSGARDREVWPMLQQSLTREVLYR